MIDTISATNFKCFPWLSLDLRPLTVLTGVNGAGKSTVIQTLLLTRQAAMEPAGDVVQLNGPHGLALGEARDVLNADAVDQTIMFEITDSGEPYAYTFTVSTGRALHLRIARLPSFVPPTLTGTGPAFSYLCAERLGPRDQLGVTAEDPDHAGLGTQGEYTAQLLASQETKAVRPQVRHADTAVTTLRTQVERWVADILRPIQISARWPAGITASLIRYQEPGLLGEEIRPANVGFGFSYVLPIIVAGLLVPEGGILIVENPEAHLHPAAQSRLGRFLARVSGSGAQVLVETHSDHFVNGVRLGIAEDKALAGADAAIYFFGGEDDGPTRIGVNDRGGLSDWPRGFFDQIETDLGRLSRAKRNAR